MTTTTNLNSAALPAATHRNCGGVIYRRFTLSNSQLTFAGRFCFRCGLSPNESE